MYAASASDVALIATPSGAIVLRAIPDARRTRDSSSAVTASSEPITSALAAAAKTLPAPVAPSTKRRGFSGHACAQSENGPVTGSFTASASTNAHATAMASASAAMKRRSPSDSRWSRG